MSNDLNRLKNYIEFEIQQHDESLSELIKSGVEKGSKLFFHYQKQLDELKSELASVEEKLALCA
jgi:hypothetical protein